VLRRHPEAKLRHLPLFVLLIISLYVYNQVMAVIISADEIKKSLPNYSPEKAEEFHSVSAKQADKEFESVLKTSQFEKVILLNGGSASGKTEFLMTQLEKRHCVIFDGTLQTPEGARVKLERIVKVNKKPIIFSVIPDDLGRAFIAFLHRDRRFSSSHFYKTHSGSRKTLLWITEHFPTIEINLIESSYTRGQKMVFKELVFNDRQELLHYLKKIQKDEADIMKIVNDQLVG